jgi:hypothetical protein
MAQKDTRSASSRRFTCDARKWARGSGVRRARMSRTSARMCFSPTSSRSAISATDTPWFKDSMNRRSWLAFTWRAARRASTDRSRGTASGGFRRYPAFGLLPPGVRRINIELFRNFRKRISYFRCRRSAVRAGRVRSCFVAPLLANDRARIWRIAPATSFIDTGALGEFYAGLEGGVAPLGRRPENIHTAAAAWVQRCGGPRMTTRGRRAATTPDASRT